MRAMKNLWKGFLGVFLAITLILLGWWRFGPYNFHGMVIQSPEPAPDFTLLSKDGPVSLSDFRGKYVLLYFGYTFCPDICPATMATLSQAINQLGKGAERVQVIMVSVDPERDTPEKIGEYVAHFHPSFIGLSGDPQEIARVASLYGIFYQKEEGTEATGYLVTHTASVRVIDPEGRLKLIWPFGTTPDEIVKDLKFLLRRR